MIRREWVQKVVFWFVICILFIKDIFPSLQSHKILDNHSARPSENSLLDFCTSELLKALKSNSFYPMQKQSKSLQKCRSPLQKFHMVSTLVLTIAPCSPIVLIKITPWTCMTNISTLIISLSIVLKWNFTTSKGRFLILPMVPMSERLSMVAGLTVLPIWSRLPTIGFSAIRPCPLS